MHHVTRLLEDNRYVLCLLIDFSKAFDVVPPWHFRLQIGQAQYPMYHLKLDFLLFDWQYSAS